MVQRKPLDTEDRGIALKSDNQKHQTEYLCNNWRNQPRQIPAADDRFAASGSPRFCKATVNG